MRSADLAVYADALAGEAAALSARLERARRRLREAAIEQEARRALPREAVSRLVALGLLSVRVTDEDTAEIASVQASLAALDRLQEWVERELAAAACERQSVLEPTSLGM